MKGQIRHQRLRPRSGTTLMQTRRAGSRVRKALPDRLGHKAIKVLRGRLDRKDYKDYKDQKEMTALMVCQVRWDRRARRVSQARKVIRETSVLRDRKGLKESRDRKARKV